MPMINIADYALLFNAIWTAIALLLLQWAVASGTKASSDGAVPGKLPADISHESFVFRAHRTFQNSLENYPAFIALALLAPLVAADAYWSGVCAWVFVGARAVHMVLYYGIATERNPSPRSYFFMLGLLAIVGLLILTAAALW